jgi:hypothetical protein
LLTSGSSLYPRPPISGGRLRFYVSQRAEPGIGSVILLLESGGRATSEGRWRLALRSRLRLARTGPPILVALCVFATITRSPAAGRRCFSQLRRHLGIPGHIEGRSVYTNESVAGAWLEVWNLGKLKMLDVVCSDGHAE